MLQTGPPENIEIAAAIHVLRIEFASGRIEEVILDDHLIPCGNKVDVDVVGNLEVSIHSQETSNSTVSGIMEGDGIQSINRGLAQEEFIMILGEVDCRQETRRKLCWGTSTTTGKCVK